MTEQPVDGRMRRRLRWFDLGAEAVARSMRIEQHDIPAGIPLYLCPLCGRVFNRECVLAKILTDEHVPTEAVGGRRMVLTCAKCNNDDGSRIDYHAAEELKTRRFFAGTGKPTVVGIDETNVRGLLAPGPRQWHLRMDRAHSNPWALDTWWEGFERRLASIDPDKIPLGGVELCTFWVPSRADPRKAALSFLRAGYLTVFALWGYRVILGPSYQPIRRQLRYPDDAVLKQLPVGQCRSRGNEVFQGFHPTLGLAVVVRLGDRWVTLPPGGQVEGWWDRLADAAVLGAGIPFRRVRQEVWPREPMHLSDLRLPPPTEHEWRRLYFLGDAA